MGDMFGCCSSFTKCSDNLACIYLDNPWSLDCYYRKNLEAGKIFYGKNANQNKNCKGEKEIMEIKILLEAPELSAAIRELAGALAGGITKLPAETAVKATTGKNTKSDKVADKAAEKATETLATEKTDEIVEETNTDADLLGGDDVKVYTLEEVRATLTKLSQAGKSTEMRQLINSFNVSKLTDIPADKYPELMEKAGKIK